MHRPVPSICRTARHRIAALSLLVALVIATSCGGDEIGNDEASPPSDPITSDWSYTDSTGATIELETAPETVVAETTIAGGLWELGLVADGTFGELRSPDGSPSPSVGLADPGEFTSLGEAYGQINLEQLAALDPDVIIAPSWEDGTYWGIQDEMIDQVRQIAPIIGVRVAGRPMDEVLAEIDDLAVALGVDAESEAAVQARQDFDVASEQLRDAAAANPGLRLLAASGTPEQFYVAVPQDYPDLSYYQSLGLGIISPETDDPFWQTLSWEEVGRYPTDVIMGDARGGTPAQVLEQLPANARQLPAIEADQLITWQIPLALGYGAVAGAMRELAEFVPTARSGLS